MKNATGARETQLGKRGCSIRPGPGVYSGGGQGMKKTFFFSGKERRRRKEKAGRKLQTATEGKAPHGKRKGGRADKEQTAAAAREGGRHWPLSRGGGGGIHGLAPQKTLEEERREMKTDFLASRRGRSN